GGSAGGAEGRDRQDAAADRRLRPDAELAGGDVAQSGRDRRFWRRKAQRPRRRGRAGGDFPRGEQAYFLGRGRQGGAGQLQRRLRTRPVGDAGRCDRRSGEGGRRGRLRGRDGMGDRPGRGDSGPRKGAPGGGVPGDSERPEPGVDGLASGAAEEAGYGVLRGRRGAPQGPGLGTDIAWGEGPHGHQSELGETMRKKLTRALLALSAAGFAASGCGAEPPVQANASATAMATIDAKPAVWKLSDADTTIYLFGSIH